MDDNTHADAALTRRLADRDRAALADAFELFAPTLTRYAWAQAEYRQDVEEIVQDTFLTLWQRAATIDLATKALLPWLLVVCRNHVRDHARRFANGACDELLSELPARADAVDARESLRWVRDEIAALAPIDQRICELCLLEGHSYAEAAQILGISISISIGAGAQRVSPSRVRLKKAVMHDED